MTDPLFLLGATASGKHETALLLAERLGAEIVSIDSMKVYRGMDLGTAKPTPEELGRVRHHLIDVCDPSETYSAGRFVADAARAEEEILRRGRVPLFVGGTALYYKAYVYGLFRGPSADPVLREELVTTAKERGSPVLHDELRRVDPEAASRIHPNDLKRLVRALEVHRKTGEPISSRQTQFRAPSRSVRTVWIERDREDLRRRVALRTKRMFEADWIGEVRRLLAAPWGREGSNAVGYREVIELIEGRRTREETEAEINRRTDKFIRRQQAWFRSFPEAKSVAVSSSDPPGRIADEILRQMEGEDRRSGGSRIHPGSGNCR